MKLLSLIAGLFLMSFSLISTAAEKAITDQPSAWVMEDNLQGTMRFFNTKSSCKEGRLMIPVELSEREKNKIWLTILTAKVEKLSVTVFYQDRFTDCPITKLRVNAE